MRARGKPGDYPLRSGLPVCLPRPGPLLEPEPVVARTRHRRRVHASGLAAGQRLARTDASRFESGGDPAALRQFRGPAAPLRTLAAHLQPRPGPTSRSTSSRRRSFTSPAPVASARTTGRWSIPRTTKSKSSPAPASSRTRAATTTSATPSSANASACGSTPQGKPSCTLPTCISAISPSMPRAAGSPPRPTSPPLRVPPAPANRPLAAAGRAGREQAPSPAPSLNIDF